MAYFLKNSIQIFSIDNLSAKIVRKRPVMWNINRIII